MQRMQCVCFLVWTLEGAAGHGSQIFFILFVIWFGSAWFGLVQLGCGQRLIVNLGRTAWIGSIGSIGWGGVIWRDAFGSLTWVPVV